MFVKCEHIDHPNVIFRRGPRSTHVVLAGDLVPAGTTLVTPDLMYITLLQIGQVSSK